MPRRYIALAVLIAPALAAGAIAFSAARDARAGQAHLTAAQAALRDQRPDDARARLRDAAQRFERAEVRLTGAPARLIGLIPVLGRQVHVAASLARSGILACEAGVGAADAVEARGPDGWAVSGGRIDVEALSRAAEAIERSLPPLERAVAEMEASPAGLLLPPLGNLRDRALRESRAAHDGALKAVQGLRVAPAMLGSEGPRRYMVAFGNLGELRGNGGFIGYFTTLRTDAGAIALGRDEGRPQQELPELREFELQTPDWLREHYSRYGVTEIWQNVNVPVDFPVAAEMMVQAGRESLGPLDGVIQIDPSGLVPFLRATGPVEVQGWPDPIGAENIERITQLDAYVTYRDTRARFDFLGRVMDEVFARFLASDLPLTTRFLDEVAQAAASGHIQVYATRPGEQDALSTVGVTRSVDRPAPGSDVIGLAGVNSGGNKIDWFLRRDVTYEVALDVNSPHALGRFRADLHNEAPSEGLPDYVIGTAIADDPPPRGTNRQTLLLVRPPGDVAGDLTIGGDPYVLNAGRERRMTVWQAAADIPAGGTTRVEGEFLARDVVTADGHRRTYRLHLMQQPVATPDIARIRIAAAPKGWTVTGPTSWEGRLDRDMTFEVTLTHTLRARMVDQIFLRPWRLARSLVADAVS